MIAEYDTETNTWTHALSHPARQTFRQAVAQVAEKARAILPQAVNGRVEAAVKLVLAQDVEPQADGSILVGSSSDPMKQHRLEGHSCTCQDFVHGRAPEGWCQHRIAAGIAKRVQELLPQAPAPLAPPVAPATAPAPLPEAPCSVNVRVLVAGREVQWTLRDHDEARLATRLEALLTRYPVAQPPAQDSSQGEGWCSKHGLQMRQTTKDGRSWWSHRHDGQWCKGK
jgi:hypothetical protein